MTRFPSVRIAGKKVSNGDVVKGAVAARPAYIPKAGDIVWLDFDPQAGREQANRRPALVVTEQSYNRASGLVVVCPLTSRRKSYPFALPVKVDKVEGAVLVDHVKSVDWAARKAAFHSKADAELLAQGRAYLGVLLGVASGHGG